MPIAGSYRIHRHTFSSAHFVASRLAGRIVVSLCRLSIQSHIRCDFDCLLTAAGSVVVVSSRRAVPSCVSCLLAARLAFAVSSHRLSSRPSVSPLLDTVGRDVRRGASVLCLLGSALRSVPMSIAGSCRFLCGVPSVCLLCRLGCGEEG